LRINFQKEYSAGNFDFNLEFDLKYWAIPIAIFWSGVNHKIPSKHLMSFWNFYFHFFCFGFSFTWWKWGRDN
jgi:hypothetical protein